MERLDNLSRQRVFGRGLGFLGAFRRRRFSNRSRYILTRKPTRNLENGSFSPQPTAGKNGPADVLGASGDRLPTDESCEPGPSQGGNPREKRGKKGEGREAWRVWGLRKSGQQAFRYRASCLATGQPRGYPWSGGSAESRLCPSRFHQFDPSDPSSPSDRACSTCSMVFSSSSLSSPAFSTFA